MGTIRAHTPERLSAEEGPAAPVVSERLAAAVVNRHLRERLRLRTGDPEISR